VKLETESFKQSVQVITIPKRFSVFIQTDKPLYKLGDLIKFRILVINFEMKPYQVNKLRVEFIDSLGNVIRDLEEEDVENGVYVGDYKVAEETFMGTWAIRATVNDDINMTQTYNFEVKEYVLPRFEVLVDTKHDVAQLEENVKLIVYANYTFGEFVKGTAKVLATVIDSDFPEDTLHSVSKTVEVEFKKMVEFNIVNDLKIVNSLRPYDINFEVIFKEHLTGQVLTKTVRVRVHKTGEFTVQLIGERKTFKPGFPYKLQAIVKKFDGTIERNQFDNIDLKIKFFYKPLLCTLVNSTYLSDRVFESHKKLNIRKGLAVYSFDIAENTTAVSVSAQYMEAKASLNISRFESRSREYITIKIDSTR